jgi:catechol 2,3-dioxygenase-like lactoylglutathione lyase family enzyme
MEPIDCLGFDHIDLTVNEMGRSTAWYGRVLGRLGFDVFKEESASGSVIFMNGITSIAIRPTASEQQGATFDRYRVGLHHLALRAACREDVDRFHDWLVAEGLRVLDAPAEYPAYGQEYYAVFFSDPDGMKLELVHFPWGYWRRAQTNGQDDRARYPRSVGRGPPSSS